MWCVGFHACSVSFAAMEDSRHPLVFVFTSGCCGGPELVERTVFKSKPIRMHFCCTHPPFLTPTPLPHPVTSPRTNDVTDCCEHCFHGNAHHRFGLHFRQLSLPPFSNQPLPPSLSPSLSPLPAAKPPHYSPDKKEGLGHKAGWGGTQRKLTAADRKKNRTFTGGQKQL